MTRQLQKFAPIMAIICLISLNSAHAEAPHGLKRLPQCRDRKDNDRDGRIDFPADKGCKSRNDNSESPNPHPTPRPTRTPTSIPTPSGTPGDSPGEVGDNVSLNGRRPFPDDNPWNQDVSNIPVDPNSATLIASIGSSTGLHPDFGTVYNGAPNGIPYTVVTGDQPKVPVSFYYDEESDHELYPIPSNPPIEGGTNGTGDRHILIIDKDNWRLFELFDAHQSNGSWTAGSGAIFNLNSNDLRPAGWTSADAAGLPIFPGLARYDEIMEQGEIRHALRFTASRTRRAYVSPARHFASSNTSSSLPPMGMRVRLKASFNTSGFTQPVKVILEALKKYGMFLADNGSNWFISGAPDPRWDDDALHDISRVHGSDFEVVQMGQIGQ